MRIVETMQFERISIGAVYHYCGGDAWLVGVHVIGTAGNMARYGIAMTDGDKFWDFYDTEYEDALNVGR